MKHLRWPSTGLLINAPVNTLVGCVRLLKQYIAKVIGAKGSSLLLNLDCLLLRMTWYTFSLSLTLSMERKSQNVPGTDCPLRLVLAHPSGALHFIPAAIIAGDFGQCALS